MALLGLFGSGGLLGSQDPEGLLGKYISPNKAMLSMGLGMLGNGWKGALPGLQAGMEWQQQDQNRKDIEQWATQLSNQGQGGQQPAIQPANYLQPSGPAPSSPGGRNAAAAGRIPAEAGREIYTGLLNQGFTPIQSAVLSGNIQQESNFNPSIVNEKEGAYGLIQWREGRRRALEEFARSRGVAPNDRDTQLAFIRREMEGSERGPGQAFMAATDLDSANRALKSYIRYGDDSYGTRLQNAQALLGGSGGAPQANAGSGAVPQLAAGGGGISPSQAQFYARILSNPKTPEAVSKAIMLQMGLGAKGEGFTLAPGQRRYDASGRLIASGGNTDAPTTDDIKEYGFAKQGGYTGTFTDFLALNKGSQAASTEDIKNYAEATKGGYAGSFMDFLAAKKQQPQAPSTDDIKNYEVAKQSGYAGSFMDFLATKRPPQPLIPTQPGVSLYDPNKRETVFTNPKPPEAPKLTDVLSIRGRMEALPSYKKYSESAPIFNSMTKSAAVDSRAADLDFIYGLAKIMDPESVVREGEMGMVQATQSMPDNMAGWLNNYIQGKQRLSAETRQQIMELARRRVDEYRGNFEEDRASYGGLAREYGINPNSAIPPAIQLSPVPPLPKKQPAEKPTGPRVRAQVPPPDASKLPRPQSQAEYDALAKGAYFVDPDDGQVYRKP